MSACDANVEPAQAPADVTKEGLWLGQAGSGADEAYESRESRESHVRAAFWAWWRQWLRDQEEHECSADEPDHDRSTDEDRAADEDRSTDEDRAMPGDDDDEDEEPATPPAPSGPRATPGNNPATPGDERRGYVECDANSCTTGCCESTSQCVSALRPCLSGAIVTCDGPEDCSIPGQRCWDGAPAPQCALVGPRLKCHANADCDSARPRCNAAGNCY